MKLLCNDCGMPLGGVDDLIEHWKAISGKIITLKNGSTFDHITIEDALGIEDE